MVGYLVTLITRVLELAISFNTPSTPFAFPTASRTSKRVDGGTWEELRAGRKPINGVGEENKWIKKL